MGPPGLEPGTNPRRLSGLLNHLPCAYGKEGIQSGMSLSLLLHRLGPQKPERQIAH